MITRGTILALDLSLKTGFAVGRDGGRLVWGVWNLGKQDDSGSGLRFSKLAGELEDAITVHAPELVVYEAPAGKRGMGTARLLLALCGIVEMVSSEAGIRYREEHVGTVRKLVLGHGRPQAAEGAHPKSPMLDWCRAQGWDVESDDAADALILLRYAHILGRGRVMAGRAA
jgi:Holliday junction resolvasome RuvABC endonuclease subunit